MDEEVKLPQFQGERALIIVAGFDIAKFFIAGDGRMRELSFFRVHPTEYDQNNPKEVVKKEDVFDRAKRNWRRHEFFINLKETIRVIIEHEHPTTVYLFAPKETLRRVRRQIPFWSRGKIRMTMKQNFVNDHPFTFLEQIYLKNQKHPPKKPLDLRGRIYNPQNQHRAKK